MTVNWQRTQLCLSTCQFDSEEGEAVKMFPITNRMYDQIIIKQNGQNNQNIIEYFSQ